MDLIKTLEILKINNPSKGDLDKRELLRPFSKRYERQN